MKLNIGISCYPTFGGSGVMATELGIKLADLGHEVHFITYEIPTRLREFHENIYFHNVEVMPYPLFQYPPYSLALANKIAEVTRYAHLNILHAHYAVPHATSAYLARQMLSPWCLHIVTTLHGTDITLVGSDPSYLPITRFSIEQSDAVTAVSHWLRRQTIKQFHSKRKIDVVHNFVDTDRFQPGRECELRERLAPKGEKLMMHVSNFRPLKRTMDLIDIFTFVRLKIPAKLILIGDGPDRAKLEAKARSMGQADNIIFLGNYAAIEELLPCADVVLVPSSSESFGLVALEAMSCGIPVVGTNIGGIPEVVEHGKTGFLFDVGDSGAMAEAVIELFSNQDMYKDFSSAARSTAVVSFNIDDITQQYVEIYERLMLNK